MKNQINDLVPKLLFKKQLSRGGDPNAPAQIEHVILRGMTVGETAEHGYGDAFRKFPDHGFFLFAAADRKSVV